MTARNPKTRIGLVVKIAISAVILILVINVSLSIFLSPTQMELVFRPRGKEPFVSAAWKSATDAGERYEMVDSLISSKVIVGMGREDVIHELGLPSDKINCSLSGSCDFIYGLGDQGDHPAGGGLLPTVRSGNCDAWFLVVDFDHEKVERLFIMVN